YLHANCSHCHVADGGGNARIELEIDTKKAKTQIFDVAPLQGDFDIVDARLVAPGDPYRSVILYRISKLGRGRMPRLGSAEVDQRAVRLLHDWIQGLPPETSTTTAQSAASLREGDRAAITALSAAKDATAEMAAKAVDRLLSTTNGAILLLSAMYDGRVNGPVAKAVVQRASEHASVEVRDLFETFLPESQRLKRLGNVFDPQAILAMQGDPARGEVLFFKTAGVQCQSCHQIKGQGREVGPDLSTVGKKLAPPQILESIIDPSKAVEEKFVTYLVETTDGLVRGGILVEKTDREVVLRDSQNQLIRVPAADVELMVKQRKSLMPELMLRDVTAQQAADLLAYLTSLK
ncbi:MAG: c-type cytochrome, partial [Planctomycetaceae bacterium]